MNAKRMTVLFTCGAAAAALTACSSGAASSAAPASSAQPESAAVSNVPEQVASGEEVLFSDINLDGYQYVDISHLVEAEMPADPALKLPELDFFSEIGKDDALYNLEVVSYCPHTGTHMDAPFHVLEQEGTIESVDPTVLIGPACIIRLDVDGDYEITVDDVKNWEAEHGEIQPGEAVLFDTNHDLIWESDPQEYITNYPHLIAETAEYLVEKGARFVGCEAISPDTSEPVCHKILLGGGTEVVENVCNLDQVKADRCYVVATFANAQGSTGVWTRLLAYYK